MAHPMGESKDGVLRLDFDRRLRLEFHGSKVSSDAGLLPYRELDDAVGLTEIAGDALTDTRRGKNGRHGLVGQFRQSVFGRLGGYDDVNDADRLSLDPVMRWIVGGQAVTKQAASTSQMGRFETELLATDGNVEALADMNGVWIDKVHDRHPPTKIILDMDSSVSPTHGEQEGSAYNGHFRCSCYHPVFLFNQFGDLERSSLRPGNVHSADDWEGVLKPVVVRYKGRKVRLYFRGDAAFASPDIYDYLEAEGFLYAIRLPKNQILQESIGYLLTRPVGRPPNHVQRYYAGFSYQSPSEKFMCFKHSFLSMRRIDAKSRKARAVLVRFSKSLASRRHLPSQANVLSTTHRLGMTSKPTAVSDRLTISVSKWGKIFFRAWSNTGPWYPPSAKSFFRNGNLPNKVPRTRTPPSRSWILAGCTMACSNRPTVSTRMWRFLPLIFLPAS